MANDTRISSLKVTLVSDQGMVQDIFIPLSGQETEIPKGFEWAASSARKLQGEALSMLADETLGAPSLKLFANNPSSRLGITQGRPELYTEHVIGRQKPAKRNMESLGGFLSGEETLPVVFNAEFYPQAKPEPLINDSILARANTLGHEATHANDVAYATIKMLNGENKTYQELEKANYSSTKLFRLAQELDVIENPRGLAMHNWMVVETNNYNPVDKDKECLSRLAENVMAGPMKQDTGVSPMMQQFARNVLAVDINLRLSGEKDRSAKLKEDMNPKDSASLFKKIFGDKDGELITRYSALIEERAELNIKNRSSDAKEVQKELAKLGPKIHSRIGVISEKLQNHFKDIGAAYSMKHELTIGDKLKSQIKNSGATGSFRIMNGTDLDTAKVNELIALVTEARSGVKETDGKVILSELIGQLNSMKKISDPTGFNDLLGNPKTGEPGKIKELEARVDSNPSINGDDEKLINAAIIMVETAAAQGRGDMVKNLAKAAATTKSGGSIPKGNEPKNRTAELPGDNEFTPPTRPTKHGGRY